MKHILVKKKQSGKRGRGSENKATVLAAIEVPNNKNPRFAFLKKVEDIKKHLPWVHILISNLKSSLRAIFHGVSKKHLQRYLDEYSYRFNRRFVENQLFDRLLFACTVYKTVSYSDLTG